MARKRAPLPPSFDPAADDVALAAACQDLLIGRWQSTRDLLRDSYGLWGPRTFRARVLAETACNGRTVESWQAAEPDNPDALVLRAETEVARAFAAAAAAGARDPREDSIDRTVLERVRQVCWYAAEAAPADPLPWISLLTLARLYGDGHPEVWRWWREVLHRDPGNREAHHQALRHLSARWHGSHGDMYNFARDSAATAPPGSPLPVLAQAARVEHFRHLVRLQGKDAPGLTFHWNNDVAHHDLLFTVRHWLAHIRPPAPAPLVADLNILAHGLVLTTMYDEAARVFRLLDNRAATAPWLYTGDATAQFVRWRDQLAGR